MQKSAILFSLLFLLLTTVSAQQPDLTALVSNQGYPAPNTSIMLKPPAFDYEDYGGKVSIGISILDGFGVPARFYLNHKNVFEGGLYIGNVLIYNSDRSEIEDIQSGFMAGAGYSYFGNRFLKEKKRRNKVRAHGVAIRAKRLFGDFQTNFISLGWASETFRENRPNRSFIFELGIQGSFPDFTFENRVYDDPVPGIYLRCHWNFFLD